MVDDENRMPTGLWEIHADMPFAFRGCSSEGARRRGVALASDLAFDHLDREPQPMEPRRRKLSQQLQQVADSCSLSCKQLSSLKHQKNGEAGQCRQKMLDRMAADHALAQGQNLPIVGL